MARMFININAQVLGLTLGILCALGLFVATNILVFKGGSNVGAHLGLLCQFFYGYSVTHLGSFIGAAWAMLTGYLAGWIIGIIYNWVAYLRNRS